MIDAVTYGMIPSAKSEKRESAEPEKRFSRPRGCRRRRRALRAPAGRRPAPAPTSRGGTTARIAGGEEHAPAQLGDAPRVGEPGEHLAPPRPPGCLGRVASSSAAASSACASSAASSAAGSLVAAGAALRWRSFLTFGSRRSSTVPPAASIFSRADRGDRVDADGELLRHLAVAEQLHVDLRVLEQALLDERSRA